MQSRRQISNGVPIESQMSACMMVIRNAYCRATATDVKSRMS